jgi:drug/metabolite transporter (DMT)-like permease
MARPERLDANGRERQRRVVLRLPDRSVERRPGTRASALGLTAVIVSVFGWSVANTVPKLLHLGAVGFAFYRLWMGALAMVAVFVALRRRLTWRQVLASAPGGVLFGVTIALFVAALRRTGVADVLVIGALQPALTLIVAGPLFGERVTASDVLWTGVATAGVVVSVLGASENPVWSLQGDLMAVAAVALWTVYFLLSKHVRATVPAVEYMTAVTIVAAVTVTPIAIASGEGLGQIGRIRVVDWVLLAVFVAVAQGGHLAVAWAHAHVDISISTLVLLAEPAIGAAAALLILGEPLTWLQIVGGLVVMVSIGLVMRRATRTQTADVSEPMTASQ